MRRNVFNSGLSDGFEGLRQRLEARILEKKMADGRKKKEAERNGLIEALTPIGQWEEGCGCVVCESGPREASWKATHPTRGTVVPVKVLATCDWHEKRPWWERDLMTKKKEAVVVPIPVVVNVSMTTLKSGRVSFKIGGKSAMVAGNELEGVTALTAMLRAKNPGKIVEVRILKKSANGKFIKA